MGNLEFMWNLTEVEKIENVRIEIIKIIFICFITLYLFAKITDLKYASFKKVILTFLCIPLISVFAIIIRGKTDIFFSWLVIILFISLLSFIKSKNNYLYSLSLTIISFSISYVLYIIAVAIAFVPIAILKIESDYFNIAFIVILYFLIIKIISKLKRIKYGIASLQRKLENSFFNILILNIGAMTLFSLIALKSYTVLGVGKVGIGFSLLSIALFMTIKTSIDIYYKQNLLVKDLEETKTELEAKNKEINKLEKENLEYGKRSHSLAHKQKALEFKLENLMKTQIDEESKKSIKEEIEDLNKEVYKEPGKVGLVKTGIESIDNMLSYMQSECINDNIEFELQVVGNIYYMINNLITENDLEILIADHIKDAIFAINFSDNSNRSILVRIGKIDNIYSLYIYDSGIEFSKEVLDNIGKNPITTHEETGGTGMGFMNTFDTLNKTKASFIINEIGKPCEDNYTKVLIFKFDNKNEFKVNSDKSYKDEVLAQN